MSIAMLVENVIRPLSASQRDIIVNRMPGAAPKTDYWDHFWEKGEASCCNDRGSPGHAGAASAGEDS